jgi:carbon monoxide dehydrogenase subunit G
MKLSGSYTLSAPRDEVWELLMDPMTLQRIIPGCERLEQIGPDIFAADIKLGLAGVKGDYRGTVQISDQQPPERYRIHGDGRGKPGFAKGDGTVELTAEPDGTTTMHYIAEAQVGGPVAGIGQRLIEGAARSIINQSLKALAAELKTRHAQSNGANQEAAAELQPALIPAPQSAAAETHSARSDYVPVPASPPAGLSTTDVISGMAEDLLAGQPVLRWTLPLIAGLIVGLLVGIRIGKGSQ